MNNKPSVNPLSNNSNSNFNSNSNSNSHTNSNSSGSSGSIIGANVSKEKVRKVLIIMGLCAGILLIALSFFSPKSGGGNKNTGADYDLSRTDPEPYVREQEKKICEILKRIDGVTDPFVMITLDASSEYIYASKQSVKESSSKNGETTQKEVQKDIILYENEKNSKSPILVKEIQPKIKGVAVICKGIGNAEIQLRIINLVSTVLNLPTNRVYVISAD